MRATAVKIASLLERVFELPNEAATAKLGESFAHALMALYTKDFPGLQVHLYGELGMGKTALVRATLRALGYTGRVRSPTYTLVEPYTLEVAKPVATSSQTTLPNVDLPLKIFHFDLYRFADPTEWIDAGFREYFNMRALYLIEWPQQAGDLLGAPDLEFTLELAGAGRRLLVRALSHTGKECLARC
ncbi:tRNA (adenosine(37)-N6)-threonylcarbamoyltransferase complex ATPase subunit type 1 TsaE [Mycoavidus sp. B2-EB]|uniref:tRNA (adenosine(37)-N6)-threonylcarbamoyltransferase complex ATPase subunit type 1 TsaE n=1 Tax=Mycoavidus sp. B2-EB TaxID=2651972 RepID=UPI001628FB2C|nr:tRNA (adenosine(37)-N6)-threonylcarbamoyltransferase complex ATPase subunit type 1 TsaE [Mycoavidus sp. B2-EB]BBO60405.1 bifunctional tRNA (adenosine(37)-N6)-threonylcarbamoyltransferase complex ATPase subunit type 1 TsaE/phosphotransferase [Mycoavidus sp. B2-EB]